ncbi:MAG: preprotein translocase subunit SecA [Chlamydiota bacterium]
MLNWLKKTFGSAQERTLKRYLKIVTKINDLDEQYQSLADDELRAKTDEFRHRISEGEDLDSILPEAYAVIKNVCRRLAGKDFHVSGYDQQWDMVPYDVQLLGAIAMHQGNIAEMQTGEGKTLTATMPLYLRALTGKPVHIVTVNDYLAQRDCEWMGAIYNWLGVTVGAITNDKQATERNELYQRDILYGTASEFGFDYLRDNSMATSQAEQVQRGHYFAIVDEIDSILIDEARTPLIISGPVPVSTQMYDELKGGVDKLVKYQRDLCNRLASEGRKMLEQEGNTKESEAKRQEALRKLWLVSKGTPNHKILRRIMEDPDNREAIDAWDVYYHSDQNKEERHKILSELFIIVNQRSNEYELTDKGISVWSKISETGDANDPFTLIDINDEFIKIDEDPNLSDSEKQQKKMAVRELDSKHKERSHNLRQLLRSHLLMEKDIDYIVQENKIVIIDENTGRPQPGRRFSDGLHQAIEAKEGVEIQKETQTYATVTLQNYFRMYDHLAGMSGTAITEAGEFSEIYNLDVIPIPTHLPCQRNDTHDEVYMTEREKYQALLKEIQSVHEQGRPILIGTESVEVSEKLSRILRQNKLPHTVLNAKNHIKEAEIIAEAGSNKAITVSTNMAGRGTDIKLKPGVADLGGLHVIGTTRHQARRIDRQLRGRCARQGDPGSSKFYVSFEDPLMRLFASPKITGILKRFRPPEGEPISAKMLDRAIETAQKRVEQRNYMIRKHTLQYDDVMNKQRQEVYAFRGQLLNTEDIYPIAYELLETLCDIHAEEYFDNPSKEESWDPEGYREWLVTTFPVAIDHDYFNDEELKVADIVEMAAKKLIAAFKEKALFENQKVAAVIAQGEQPRDYAAEAIRNLMIRKIDQLWQEHLLAMDDLRSEVHLHTIAQKDPLTEFKHESFHLFNEFSNSLRSNIAQNLFKFHIVPHYEGYLDQVLSNLHLETNRSFSQELDQPQEEATKTTVDNQQTKLQPLMAEEKVRRNDPCPCGSGLKYKKCCGKDQE